MVEGSGVVGCAEASKRMASNERGVLASFRGGAKKDDV